MENPNFRKPIICQGSVWYDKILRINNMVRLKKKLMDAFGDLGKAENTFYRTELYYDIDETIKHLKKLKEDNGATPILLFLSR